MDNNCLFDASTSDNKFNVTRKAAHDYPVDLSTTITEGRQHDVTFVSAERVKISALRNQLLMLMIRGPDGSLILINIEIAS
jgi:hypothetical protein